jgi:hypothetical protein
MGQKFLSGDRVKIEAGDYAGKHGVIVPRRSITFADSRKGAIPQIEGAKGPLGIHDLLVRLDNGTPVSVPKNHLSKITDGEYPLSIRVA